MTSFYKNKIAVDEKKLSELKVLLEDSFTMLIHTFIVDTGIQVLKLEEYAAEKQYLEIKKIAHSMKGASANMGAKYLSSLAEDIEESCKTQDFNTVFKSINLIKTHYPILKQILEKYLL